MRVPNYVVLGVEFQHTQNYAYYHIKLIRFLKLIFSRNTYGLPPDDIEYWGTLYNSCKVKYFVYVVSYPFNKDKP